jgi:hypothetical protein
MSYRRIELVEKLKALIPPSTTFQVALINDGSFSLNASSSQSAWLAAEVNTGVTRPTFTSPSAGSYAESGSFVFAYINFAISVDNSGSGTDLTWSHYVLLTNAGSMIAFTPTSGYTAASTTESKDLSIRLEYKPASDGSSS